MTLLKEWATVLCAVGIGCAILRMLCPKGVMRRTFQVLTAMAFLCCLLVPVGSLGELWDTTVDATEQDVPTALSDATAERVLIVLEEELVRDAQTRLSPLKVTVKKATVVRDMSRTDSIYIERVKLTFDKADHPLAASAVTTLEQAWGTVVEVQYNG